MKRLPHHGNLTVIGLTGFLIGHASAAQAADPLGAYVGAAFGQGMTDGQSSAPATRFVPASSVAFSADHSAYQLMAGVRPIPLVGAEIAYFDLGHPPQQEFAIPATFTVGSADLRMKGATAFAAFYLPVPVVDVYLKAGLARMQATSNVTLVDTNVLCAIGFPNCNVYTRHDGLTHTGFAAGAGVQWRLGTWALRAEYARYPAFGGTPHLADLGVTWTFR